VWHRDSEKSSSVARKWKEGDLGKLDEVEPPRWFTTITTTVGDKKVASQLRDNLGFATAGDLFIAKSSVSTLDIQPSVSNAIPKLLDRPLPNQGMSGPSMGGGPGAPGGIPGPGGGPATPPMPGGPPAPGG